MVEQLPPNQLTSVRFAPGLLRHLTASVSDEPRLDGVSLRGLVYNVCRGETLRLTVHWTGRCGASDPAGVDQLVRS